MHQERIKTGSGNKVKLGKSFLKTTTIYLTKFNLHRHFSACCQNILNVNFLESIGSLSDDILGSGKTMSKSRIKRIGDKFLVSQYAADKQRKQMDEMLAIGDYASLVSSDSGQYSEFDDEIDSMLESTPAMPVDPLGSKYKSRF